MRETKARLNKGMTRVAQIYGVARGGSGYSGSTLAKHDAHVASTHSCAERGAGPFVEIKDYAL